MARRKARRRNTTRRPAARAANPRRRRRRNVRRRRANPVARRRNTRRVNARARTRTVSNPRRRRHRRRSNPSGLRIGEILKDMIYGGLGAIGTRVVANAVRGLAPGMITGMLGVYTEPAIQAAAAVIPIRYLGKKFLGQKQADMLMLGGLISAGLALADAAVPNLQGRIQSYIPNFAPQVALPPVVPVTGSGLGDVYDVDMVAAGFGDVEEVPLGIWG